MHFFENVKAKRRRNQYTVGGARTLLGFEFRTTMARADRNSEAVHPGFLDKIFDFFGPSVMAHLCGHIVFNARKHTEFTFYRNIVFLRMGKFHDFFSKRDILIVRQM